MLFGTAPLLHSKSIRLFLGVVLALLSGCQQMPRPAYSTSMNVASTSTAESTPSVRSSSKNLRVSKPAIVLVSATEDSPESSDETKSWFPGQRRSRAPSRLDPEEYDPPTLLPEIATGADHESRSSAFDDPDRLIPLNGLNGESDDEETENLLALIDQEESCCNSDDDGIISFKKDVCHLPRMLWDDNLSLYTWRNAIILGIAAGASVAIRDNLDHRVRYETAEHPIRWGEGSIVLRQFGEYTLQVPILAGTYALSLWTDCDKLHEFSLTAISAYSLSAMYTVAIKGITNTSRPTTEFENGHYGFPSYHASSTFCLAAVIDEYYGWKLGVPAYVMAGLVSWTRIDQREHDLSDVFFGAVMGVVIGKTISAAHLDAHPNFRVGPYFDAATKSSGVSVETRF